MSSNVVARSPVDQFFDVADSGKNVFLTGQAGTGKSHSTKRQLRRRPDTAVTASTGIAALNIGGMTIHRWAGILLGPVRGQSFADFHERLCRDPRPSLKAAFNRVRKAKRLVIDEISMLPGRTLSYLDYHCRLLRECDRPFGGIQVICTGDALQLPPVRIRNDEPYDWFFDSRAWVEGEFQKIELRQIMRQGDPQFAEALSNFRRGWIDVGVERLLRPRVAVFPAREITRLFTHNSMVDRWNDYCLGELPGPESVREAQTWGPPSQIEFLEKNLLTPKVLRLKPGARVMFTVNQPDAGYVNGQIGEVVVVGLTTVVVQSAGRAIEVAPYRWRYDPNEKAGAWFEQLPLRLAYALTIHKSQGLTLDSAFIDVRAAREPGQSYTALSRVRELSGLFLKDWPKGIVVSRRALEFHYPPINS